MKKYVILLLSFFLVACATPKKPIEIEKIDSPRLPLLINDPQPLQVKSPQWIVVTPENIEKIWDQFENSDTPLVLFAITPKGYEEISLTLAEIRAFIQTQREIILAYRKYYEEK